MFVVILWTLLFSSYLSAQNMSEDEIFKQNLSTMFRRVNKSIKILREQIASNQNAPFLANLYLQLGDLYSQKANVLYYVRMEREKRVETTTKASKKFSAVIGAQKEAISVYRKIIKEFPNFNKKAKTMYALAVALKSIDEIPKFIKITRKIIAKYPGKNESEKAQLLLGQHYFDRKQFAAAIRELSLLEKSSHPYERNLARYRLGLIEIYFEKFKSALKYFEQVITDRELSDSDSPFEVSLKQKTVRPGLKREALIDSIRAFTEVFKKKADPVGYYSKITPTENLFQEVIEKLAFRYVYLKRFKFAIKMLRTLSERTVHPQKIINIYQEVLLMIPVRERVDLPVAEIRFLLEKYNLWRSYYDIPKKFLKQSYAFLEKQVRDLGTRAHDLAKKSGRTPSGKKVRKRKARKKKARKKKVRKRKVRNKKTRKRKVRNKKARKRRKYNFGKKKRGYYLTKASDYYSLYLSFFDKSKNAVKIATNLADVYFQQKKYMESGSYYLRAFSGEFGPPIKKRELIKNALFSLQKNSEYSFFQLVRVKGLLIKALSSYMDFDPKQRRNSKLNFILAKSRYEQGMYEQALTDLHLFMKRFPQSKYAVAAGELILDYFNTRNDYAGLVLWANKILSINVKNKKFVRKVSLIRKQAQLKRLQSQVEAAADFDTFAQGKSYLEGALKIKDKALMDIALQRALTNSKKERDMKTFFQTAIVMAKKSKNLQKKNSIVNSMAQENMRVTNFIGAIGLFKKIYNLEGNKLKNRKEAFDDAANLAITLRDYERINQLRKNRLWRGLAKTAKRRLQDQIADLLESPIEIPDDLAPIIRSVGISNSILQGLIKAQYRIDGSLKAILSRGVNQRCRKKTRSSLCGWARLPSIDAQIFKFKEALRVAPAKLNHIEVEANKFMKLSKRLQFLEGGDDSHLDIVLSIKNAYLYKSFGQYLQRVAKNNKAVRQVLMQKASESLKSGSKYFSRCKTIIRKFSLITPANKYCMAGENLSLKDAVSWGDLVEVPDDIDEVEGDDVEELKKSIFASGKSNNFKLELAKLYFDKEKYNHAVTTAAYGMSEDPSRRRKYKAVLGCSLLKLGYFNEAKFHLKNASNFEGLKRRCVNDLKRLGAKR